MSAASIGPSRRGTGVPRHWRTAIGVVAAPLPALVQATASCSTGTTAGPNPAGPPSSGGRP